MVSRRRCDDLSIGDDSTAASLPAGLLMPCSTVLPETSACATQPLRRLANSAAVAIHVSDACIAVSLPFFSLVILHGTMCLRANPGLAGHEEQTGTIDTMGCSGAAAAFETSFGKNPTLLPRRAHGDVSRRHRRISASNRQAS